MLPAAASPHAPRSLYFRTTNNLAVAVDPSQEDDDAPRIPGGLMQCAMPGPRHR